MGEETESFISHESTYIVLPEMIWCDLQAQSFGENFPDCRDQRDPGGPA